jgi:ATP-binding protein involved in chromosome partitioning
MAITKEQVLDALSNVIDPDLHKDIVTLGMVEELFIDGMDVHFTVNLTTPACPMKEQIQRAAENAIIHLVDENAVPHVTMTANVRGQGPTSVSDRPADPAVPENMLAGVRNIIAVASGKGGVGKSTVSVNIAVALAKTGAKVGLVDTDIYGPSIPTMFATNERPNINTQRKLIPIEKYGVKLLSMGFLVDPDQAVVWRGPMVSSAVKQFLTDSQWGELDYLVMDLPPGTGDIQLTIVQTVPLTGAVIVSTPQDVALDDARKGVAMFKKVNVPVLGIVENMAYFTPPDAPDKKYHIFGKDGARNLATRLDVPFLGEVPLEQMVREGGDEGLPAVLKDETSPAAVALTEIAIKVAQQVSIRNMTQDATQKVEILFKP